jgi:CHASE2 domain-containing sensor protein
MFEIPGILLSSVAVMALGFAWYSDLLFGKAWRKLVGMKDKEVKKPGAQMQSAMSVMVAGVIIQATTLSWLGTMLLATDLVEWIKLAVTIWFGFILTTSATHSFFARRPVQLLLIDMAYSLASVVLSAVIFATL